MHGNAAPSPARGTGADAPKSPKARRAFWLKQLHGWHWVSSAISLVGLLLFTITGITLNHAGQIEASPVSVEREAQLPEALLPLVEPASGESAGKTERPLPAPVAEWLKAELDITPRGVAEWSADEIYLGMPRPGGDAWVSIDRESGAVLTEATSRGVVSYLNDLHKGRNTGIVWYWFIDVFAVACLVFSITGLVLLWLHAHRRPSTWPLVGFGLLLPLLIAIAFIH